MGEQLNGLFGLKNVLLNGVEKVFRQTWNFIGDGWGITEGVDDKGKKTVEVRFTPSGGGGGPGYGIMYVHQDSGIDVGAQDGSEAKPFASFMAAHAALPSDGGVIYVLETKSDGSPVTGDETIAFTKKVALVSPRAMLFGDSGHGITSSADLYVEGLTTTLDEGGGNGPIRTTAGNLTCRRCTASFQASGIADLENCTAAGGSSQTVSVLNARNVHATAPFIVADGGATLRGCYMGANLYAAGEISMSDSDIAGNLTTSSTEAQFASCRWAAGTRSLTFDTDPGVMLVDAMSNYWWKAATETLTNGTKTVQADILA